MNFYFPWTVNWVIALNCFPLTINVGLVWEFNMASGTQLGFVVV